MNYFHLACSKNAKKLFQKFWTIVHFFSQVRQFFDKKRNEEVNFLFQHSLKFERRNLKKKFGNYVLIEHCRFH